MQKALSGLGFLGISQELLSEANEPSSQNSEDDEEELSDLQSDDEEIDGILNFLFCFYVNLKRLTPFCCFDRIFNTKISSRRRL